MKILFLIEHSIYLFSRIDARSSHGFIPKGMHSKIWVLYTLLILLQYLVIKCSEYKYWHVILFSKNFFVIIPILAAYFLTLFGEYTNLNEELSVLNMLIDIYISSELIKKYNCFKKFAICSFGIIIIYLIIIIIMNRINLLALIGNVSVKQFFSSRYASRFHFEFGGINPNYIGNIGTCSLLVSAILFAMNEHYQSKKRKCLIRVILAILDLFCFTVIVVSGCRGAFLALFAFSISFIYLILDSSKIVAKKQILVIGFGSIIFATIFTAIAGLGIRGIEYYLGSGRGKAFQNLKFLNNIRRFLFGIGLPKTEMSNLYIDGISGDSIDVYYVYILVTSGIVGAILIIFSLVKLWNELYKNITLSMLHKIFFCCYISQLVYGMVEACVLLPSAPSCEVYFPILLASIDYHFMRDRDAND